MSILPPLLTSVLQDSFFCLRLATLTSPNGAAPNIYAAARRGTIDVLTIFASSTCPSTSESIAEAPFFDVPATVDTSTLISASTTLPLVSARALPNSASPVVALITEGYNSKGDKCECRYNLEEVLCCFDVHFMFIGVGACTLSFIRMTCKAIVMSSCFEQQVAFTTFNSQIRAQSCVTNVKFGR